MAFTPFLFRPGQPPGIAAERPVLSYFSYSTSMNLTAPFRAIAENIPFSFSPRYPKRDAKVIITF
jgi:hypothetical protein